ncbi:hypothetical protein SARC_06290 [Sphaeroforma arctica JP610]|uniref:Uncharacterized protein n=1 Tax=Sphaeroforma arctica JP610 TaxID=667725 RepID=A0A0L0FX12_9EUKA|nr:hypothetical protein SARC_06290 [Sphaeroforma arctica JP610]KNC81385.1 hypothetical protein SARC_06290 [Sphaeroforma arctica JP610]|eukprot:XP_014155287.1 hypothetical protein SARC_06290 [Sphaeroforma arctica JP610]
MTHIYKHDYQLAYSRSVKAATNERDLSEPTDMPMADVQTSESILHARVPNSAHVVSAAKASPLGLAKNKPMQHTQRKGRAKTSSGKVSGTRTGERASRSIMSYFGAKNVDKPVVVSEGVVAVKGVGAQVARSGRNNGGRAGRRLQIGKSNAECVDLTAEEGPDSGSNSEQGSSDTSGIIGPIPANVQPTVEQALPEKAGSGSDTNANSSLPTTGPSGTGDGEACASMDVDEEPRTTGTAIANEMAEKASTTNEIADKEMNTNDRKAADICTNVQSSTAKVGEAATVQVDSGEEEMASTHPREQERSSERSSVHTIVPTATKDTPEEIPKNSEAGIAEMYLGVDKGESVNETEGLSAGEGDEVVAMETEELQKTAAKEASLTFPLYTIVWAK